MLHRISTRGLPFPSHPQSVLHKLKAELVTQVLTPFGYVQLFVQRPPWDTPHTLWEEHTAVQYVLQSDSSALTEASDPFVIEIFRQNFSRGGFVSVAFARTPQGQRMVAKRILRERRQLQGNVKELEVRALPRCSHAMSILA